MTQQQQKTASLVLVGYSSSPSHGLLFWRPSRGPVSFAEKLSKFAYFSMTEISGELVLIFAEKKPT